MTSQGNSSRFRTPSGGPLLREAPVGTKLLLKDKSIVEIVGNPGDGGWVNVKYVQVPEGGHDVDDEEWVFYTDVVDFAQEMPS
jgi:hypothetical protein